MTVIEVVLLISVGVIAGGLNTIAGGGSMLTLPLLIFMGLPSAEANASNRVAIIFQNIFAVKGFQSKGVSVFPYAIWAALSACIGAVFGAIIAANIEDAVFNKILAIIMVLVGLSAILKPLFSKKNAEELFSKKKNVISIGLFFFIGIYGGFIQAGVGFLIIATLSIVHGIGMARLNSIKVFVALAYTVIAIGVFIYEDLIRWEYGLVLAIGNALGGWFVSRWSVSIPDNYVRAFLLVTISALAIKLWFF